MDKKSKFHNIYYLLEISFYYIGLDNPKPQGGFWKFVKKYKYAVIQFAVTQLTVLAEIWCFIDSISMRYVPDSITALACFVTCILAELKLGFIMLHSDKVDRLKKELLALWPEEPHPPYVDRIMSKTTTLVKILMYGLNISYQLLIQAFDVMPLFYHLNNYFRGKSFEYILPYPTKYPFEMNLTRYILLVIMQIHGGTWIAQVVATSDSFLYFCIANLSMQFDILADDLNFILETHHHKWHEGLEMTLKFRNRLDKKAVTYPYDNDHYEIDNNEDLYHTLANHIKKHIFLMDLVNDLNKIFGFTILVNIMSSSILICLTGFGVINSKNMRTSQIIEFSISVPTKVFQILLICGSGERLITSSTKVALAALSSKWYLADEKFRKALLVLILRSQRPSTLNAMGFSVVSLTTFTSVIGTAWSYITLLKSTLMQ